MLNTYGLNLIGINSQAPEEKEGGSVVAAEGAHIDTDDEYIHDDDVYTSDK